MDIAEQTVTPALAIHVEGVKIDICGSLLLFIHCLREANVAHRKVYPSQWFAYNDIISFSFRHFLFDYDTL